MKKFNKFAACMAVLMCFGAGNAFAGEIDMLVKKLVEKGVITQGEAQQLVTETQEQVKKEIAQAKSIESPEWVQRIKFKGDARVRYQHSRKKTDNFIQGQHYSKDTLRARLRLGTEAKVNDQTKVYAGLASGSDANPNSTNQTFTDEFAKKPIWIDYVYVEYSPFTWAMFDAGKMKNPIWEPGDNMLWDGDINPEGLAVKLNKSNVLNDLLSMNNFDVFLNSGYFLLQQNDSGGSSLMAFAQPGFTDKITDTVSLKGAFNYYYFQNIHGLNPTWPSSAQGSDRFVNAGRQGYQWGYNSYTTAGELAITDPFKPLNNDILNRYVPYLDLFGEWHHNYMAPYSKNGYMGGVKLGQEKVDDWAKWQFRYTYVLLESQSWPDMFPDSDRYGGRVGTTSHKFWLSYGLGKNWDITITDWVSGRTSCSNNTQVISTNQRHQWENVLMADLNWKF